MNFTPLLQDKCVKSIQVFDNRYVLVEHIKSEQPLEDFSSKINQIIKQFGKSKVVYLIENYKHWSNKTQDTGFITDYLERNHVFTVSCVDSFSVDLFSNINNFAKDLELLQQMCQHMNKHHYPHLLADFFNNYTSINSYPLKDDLHVRIIQSVLYTTIINDKTLATNLYESVRLLSKTYKHFLICETNENKKKIHFELLEQLKTVKILLKDFFDILIVWKMMSYVQEYPSSVFILQGSGNVLRIMKDILKYKLKNKTQNSLRMYNHLN